MQPLPLAVLPTPIEYLPRLSAELGVNVHVKRDDLTGSVLSGNKIRKLQFLLADALDRGARAVVTCGGVQSNHARATAIACRKVGLHPILLLRGDISGVPEANLLLDRLVDAEIVACTPEQYRDRRDQIMANLAKDRDAVVIPEGGSNALGALAYAMATQEVEDRYDAVFVAVGSGGTLAGLAIGNDIGPLYGVAVCDDAAYFTPRVTAITKAAARFGLTDTRDWRVVDGYQGPAYAVATPAIWSTIKLVARLEGLILDPVYTGKAMHALVTEARAGRLTGKVLFWHTGGMFGLFGRGAELEGPWPASG
jgi:D-cysteine desulfhydrase